MVATKDLKEGMLVKRHPEFLKNSWWVDVCRRHNLDPKGLFEVTARENRWGHNPWKIKLPENKAASPMWDLMMPAEPEKDFEDWL